MLLQEPAYGHDSSWDLAKKTSLCFGTAKRPCDHRRSQFVYCPQTRSNPVLSGFPVSSQNLKNHPYDHRHRVSFGRGAENKRWEHSPERGL